VQLIKIYHEATKEYAAQFDSIQEAWKNSYNPADVWAILYHSKFSDNFVLYDVALRLLRKTRLINTHYLWNQLPGHCTDSIAELEPLLNSYRHNEISQGYFINQLSRLHFDFKRKYIHIKDSDPNAYSVMVINIIFEAILQMDTTKHFNRSFQSEVYTMLLWVMSWVTNTAMENLSPEQVINVQICDIVRQVIPVV
jgi:hypothetical protein